MICYPVDLSCILCMSDCWWSWRLSVLFTWQQLSVNCCNPGWKTLLIESLTLSLYTCSRENLLTDRCASPFHKVEWSNSCGNLTGNLYWLIILQSFFKKTKQWWLWETEDNSIISLVSVSHSSFLVLTGSGKKVFYYCVILILIRGDETFVPTPFIVLINKIYRWTTEIVWTSGM